jgi:hypothetical protein
MDLNLVTKKTEILGLSPICQTFQLIFLFICHLGCGTLLQEYGTEPSSSSVISLKNCDRTNITAFEIYNV